MGCCGPAKGLHVDGFPGVVLAGDLEPACIAKGIQPSANPVTRRGRVIARIAQVRQHDTGQVSVEQLGGQLG